MHDLFFKCTIVGGFVCQPSEKLSLDENVSRAAATQLIGKILSHAININLPGSRFVGRLLLLLLLYQ